MFDIQRLKQTKLVVNETLVASDFDGEIRKTSRRHPAADHWPFWMVGGAKLLPGSLVGNGGREKVVETEGGSCSAPVLGQ